MTPAQNEHFIAAANETRADFYKRVFAVINGEQAQAVEPAMYKYEHIYGYLSDQYSETQWSPTWVENWFETKLYTHPAPPATPLFGNLIAAHDGLADELLSAKPITGPCGQCKSSADPCYCGNVNTGERAELVHALRSRHLKIDTRAEMLKAADMLEADAALADDLTIAYMAGVEAGRKQAQQAAVPDMFWNYDDAEKLYSSISEFLNDEMCQGTPLDVGDIRTVQRAVRLPNIDIRITFIDEEDCNVEYEIIEVQGAKLVTKPESRPQNCGTNHCSCIVCPYPKTDWSAA